MISKSIISGNNAGTGGSAGYIGGYMDGCVGWGGDGGGVYNLGSNIDLINSTISNNLAGDSGETIDGCTSSGGFGGGICNNGVSLKLSFCTIYKNAFGEGNDFGTRGSGGGIKQYSGSVQIKNSIIARNGSRYELQNPYEDPQDLSGDFVSLGNNIIGTNGDCTGFVDGINNDIVGAVESPIDPMLDELADNGGPTLTHALLPGSQALGNGTGTDVDGDPVLTDQRGYARDEASDIGAFEYGSNSIVACGNISADTFWDADTAKVTCDVTIDDGATLTIEPGTFVEFQGHYKLDVQGTLLAIGTDEEMITFTINDTTGFSDTETDNGGWNGLRFDETPATNDTSRIIYCKLEYSKANSAIYAAGELGSGYVFSKLVIADCLITNNAHDGIYCVNSSLTIRNNEIIDNYGNGIYLLNYDSVELTVTDNVITNNRGNGLVSDGGQIRINLILTNNTISNNHNRGLSLYLTNATFENNWITNNNGGGVNCGHGIYISTNNTICNNSADYGAGIYCHYASTLSLINNTICDNSASNDGGGIYMAMASIEAINNMICNNNALNGGGLYGDIANFTLTNNTICNNLSFSYGGGFFSEGSDADFTNTILFGNIGLEGGQVYLDNSDLNFYYCNVQGGIDDFGLGIFTEFNGLYENNIDLDPQFISPTDGAGADYDGLSANWSLRPFSPCIDAGTPDTTGLNLPATDLAGRDRIYQGRVSIIDMGAYEHQGIPTYYISDWHDLQNLQNNLARDCYLQNDLDSNTAGFADYQADPGFAPIGDSGNPFTGKFYGRDNTISGLFINRPAQSDSSLFGYAGPDAEIRNIGLINIDINGGSGLVHQNEGAIINAYTTGTISGGSAAGGLVGHNKGSISNSYSTVSVSGADSLGGLCGFNDDGTITNCYARGNISGSGEYVGGLAGRNGSGGFTNSYSTGDVSGTNHVGGLVGHNDGSITSAYYDSDNVV
ncbi:MAG: right-handed parallel beta-helix repeat-containing protein, partial [Planctomycetes bacterium]|nr:right-handed parallel beta-helix repeat-containing protein [Planctomycetota bacterium]